ncbi:MAG: lytic transglycosylase domain-containing protein [Vicinamibacteria bacterium]
MQSTTPFKNLKNRRLIAPVLASAFLSLAAEAGVPTGTATRFDPGINAVALKPRLESPGIEAADVDQLIAIVARDHGVNRHLIRAIIQAESEFDPLAMSPRGACGLMQLMPATVRRFGVEDCFDVRENIDAGTRYVKVLLTRYRGSIALSAAAYNAGELAVARHGGIPPYRETRAYVRRVQLLLATSREGRNAKVPAAT